MKQNVQRPHHRNLVGVILIVLGILFLMDTLNIMDFGHVITGWWPLILIIVGFFKLKGPDKTSGAIIFILGIVFLSATLDIINWGSIFRFWPLILIITGVSLLYRSKYRSAHKWSAAQETADDFITANAIFSGVNHTVTSRNFKGSESTALFGGVELDLRQAKISPEGCNLNLTALFGGVEIFVPTGVNISVTGTPIFGSIENKTAPIQVTENGARISCQCTVAFGSIEIRN